MRLSYYILSIFTTLAFLFGCSPSKYLKDNEYLLRKQTIKGNNNIAYEDLSPLYKQRPNRRLLGQTPYVAIYNIGRAKFDTSEIHNKQIGLKEKFDTIVTNQRRERQKLRRRNLQLDDQITKAKQEATPSNSNKKTLDSLRKIKKHENEKYLKDSIHIAKKKSKLEKKLSKVETKLNEGNWLMRAPGEAPVIFDSSLMAQTSSNIKNILNSKGFFRSSVTETIDTTRKNIRVTYKINEGISYNITKVTYLIKQDSTIDSLVRAHENEAVIKINDRYNEGDLVAERERLTKLLKNNGYYDFTRQYIFMDVDTTNSSIAEITIRINNPENGIHYQYLIDKIIFNTDITPRLDAIRDTSEYRDIKFVYYKDNFSKRILSSKLRIKQGDLYSQQKIQESQIQLASMDHFKFVNFSFEKNQDTSKKTLTTYIRTSPFNRFQVSDEWGVNVGQGFIPGPYSSLSFKNRNIFKGFEIFEVAIRYSLTSVIPQNKNGEPSRAIFMTEYGGTMSLSFPQIFFPKLGKLASKYSPRTKVIAGYNFVDRPEYKRSAVSTALNYSWLTSVNKIFNINFIDINIVNTHFKDLTFKARVDSFPALRISFRESIVTSLNAFYTFSNYQFGVVKKSKYFRPSVEIGGNVVNALSKYVTQEKGDRFLGLQYFEFFKLSVDFRKYLPTGKKNTFVLRYFAGYARPYGSSAKEFALPYEKYFFTGGSNSNRAWTPRRLGPGSYKDPFNGYKYEQPGNIIFETNYEYRKHVFKFFELGLFVDASNVWTIKNEPLRPGSQFKFDKFFTQIAVGSGIGFRFNFTFLIVRFDFGSKIWDPGEKGSDRFAGKDIFKTFPQLNIGIGYPF